MAGIAMTAPTRSRNGGAPFYLVIGLVLAALFISKMTKDGPIYDEINEAMDTGIVVPVTINGCHNFKLKDFKTPGRWRRQLRKRGFTLERLAGILTWGRQEWITDKNGRRMMRVYDKSSNDFVVVDPFTCQIWQIGPASFLNH